MIHERGLETTSAMTNTGATKIQSAENSKAFGISLECVCNHFPTVGKAGPKELANSRAATAN